MTCYEVLLERGVMNAEEHLGLVANLEDYWRDGVLVAAADIRLRRQYVADQQPDVPLKIPLLEPSREDVRIARTANDCMPGPNHSLLGLVDAFAFAGDHAKWIRFSTDRSLVSVGKVAARMSAGIASLHSQDSDRQYREDAFKSEDYVRLQTAIWCAQLVRVLGPLSIGGAFDDDPRGVLHQALNELGFPEGMAALPREQLAGW